MTDPKTEAGVIQAILQRLEHDTIPRALDIKARMDAGETLSDLDTVFIDGVLENLRRDGPYVQHHPDWEPLYARVVDLCDQITRKALENERGAA